MASKHETLRQETFLLIQNEIPESRFFKRDVGKFLTLNGTFITIGSPGMADSWGIINIKEKLLIHVEIEYKIGKDKQSLDQKNWQKMVESLGGIYLLVHDLGTNGPTPLQAVRILKDYCAKLYFE